MKEVSGKQFDIEPASNARYLIFSYIHECKTIIYFGIDFYNRV